MVGISGSKCTLRHQRLSESSTPMLMYLGQLQQMGATTDVVSHRIHRIDLKTLTVETPIEYGQKEHAMIRYEEWPQNV